MNQMGADFKFEILNLKFEIGLGEL